MSRDSLSRVALFGVVILFVLICWLGNSAFAGKGVVVTLISILAFMIFCIVVVGLVLKKDGESLCNIDAGMHNIVFMHVTDKNVSVVLANKEKNDLFYQFPVSAFNGEIIPDAKILEVVVSGHRDQFKKLHLMKSVPDGPSQGGVEV